MQHATDIPWVTKVKGPAYGADETYELAAKWLEPCDTVADWGGGRGYFKRFCRPGQEYILVDGTNENDDPRLFAETYRLRLADLAAYHEPSAGILLRHVLEMTHDWKVVLENALAAFEQRMVVVTFTPRVRVTKVATHHLTWPCYHFNHLTDLLPQMQPFLVREQYVRTHLKPGSKAILPERVYYLEKP